MRIIDAHGNPFKAGELREPQTSRIAVLQHQMIESQLDGLTPARAARILRDADQGNLTAQAQLFDDMLDRDAHCRAEYDKRRSAPVALDWSIEPPTNASAAEKAAAAYAEEVLRDTVDDLEDVILAMMDAPGYGYAGIELEWERVGRDWVPNFHPRPQTWLTTDLLRRELRLVDGTGDGAPLQPGGWILHTPAKTKTGYVGRAGLFRACLWPFLYKSYAVGDFAEFLETYGLPIILGKYMAGATPEEKASLLRAVAALGHDARAIMPEGMSLEIQKVTGGGEGSHHLAMVDWADRAQSKAILGQTTSSEAKATGMGSGIATLHGEVRHDILRSDARQVAGTLTRDLVYTLVALNRPGVDNYRRCPRWVFDLGESEDLAQYAEALPKLVGVGFKIPRAWAHGKLRIPEPDAKEDVLAVSRPDMVAPPAMRPAALRAGARWRAAAVAALSAKGGAVADTDPADQVAPRLAAAAQAQVDAWVASAEQLLADNPGLGPVEIQQRLLALYGDLPTEQLVELMAQGYALAQLVGMDDVNADELDPDADGAR
ncbi:DUF935 domain-containing protein [Thauera mechernichensis]|uniref:DUF935 domain-containing protein n=3 Tax=Thauera TaxID=33057 RepID=A0ABW3WGS1_9RHOO|nr:DUF935 domain-containing protein [Thauera mechernichensis]MDG3063263.1 DUF935 domain-containing protein [Thauera mechernichensis]